MSQTSPEGGGGRFSRWRSRTRGTNTMKAGFTLAEHNAGNLNKATLEGISRAGTTPEDLARAAQAAVNAEARGGAYIGESQRLGQVLTDRMQANRAPQGRTINPIRRATRRISRWHHQRNGAKIVKAGMVMAAKQAKNANPSVKYAMDPRGDGKLNPVQIAALVEGRLDQVFGPQAMNAQQQQAQQGPGQQGQGQVQGPGQQVPQQGAQAQQAPSLGDQLQLGQQRQIALMAEMQQLQVEMQQLIQTRMEQINQEVANLAAIQSQMAQFNQQLVQPQAGVQQEDPNARFNVGQHAIIQTDEPAVTGEPAQTGEPAVTGEPAQTGEPAVTGEAAQTGEPAVTGEAAQTGEPAVTGEAAQTGEPAVTGEAAQTGEPPVVAAPHEAEGGDQQLGDGDPAQTTEGDPAQTTEGGPAQVAESGPQQVEGGGQEATGDQLGRAEQWVQVAERQGGPDAQADPKGNAAKVKAETAAAFRAGSNDVPPRPSTAADAAKTAQSSRKDTTGAQRSGQGTGKNTPQPGPRGT